MKRLILVVTAVLVLGIISCTPYQTERPDLPDYTADQVIAVAQARYPSYDHPNMGTLSPSISVEYIGESYWRVNISFPSGYRLNGGYFISSRTLYFNETYGSLSSTQPEEVLSAAQVKALAQAKFPTASISVEFIGGSKKAWKVEISYPTSSKTWYFTEIGSYWFDRYTPGWTGP